MSEALKVDFQTVKMIREERECGIFTARKIARIDALTVAVHTAKTVDDLKPVLLLIVEML